MKMKKIVALLTVAVMACSLTAGAEGDEPLKVGIVLGTGGLGDKNFKDMAYEGLVRAQEELGIEFDYLEPETISDYAPYLRSMCESEEYGLIIGLGTDMSDAITDVTYDFPDQKFSHIDSTLDLELSLIHI